MKDFEKQWQHRQQAMKEVQSNLPSDEVVLQMARKAQERRRIKIPWISYAAAACLLFGVVLYGLRTQNKEPKFLCNSGCSIQDVTMLANRIVNQ